MTQAKETGAESKGSVARVRDALAKFGLAAEIKEFDASTRTSADAAAAIGCEVAQIAKSVLFRAKSDNRAVLVVASGTNRVDEKKLAVALNDGIGRADAEFVRGATGFAIGGVAPVGHTGPVTIFIDEDLRLYGEIWAAAGSPNAVFRLTPSDLERITNGRVIAVK
jgi:prolyl-tRNA editing enzyme YbaK/EbsC (Cys-tRNA(Pro) deacylase)